MDKKLRLMALLIPVLGLFSVVVFATEIDAVANPAPYEATPEASLGKNEGGKGLEVGTKVDGKSLLLANIEGEPYRLLEAWQSTPALIVFYRGGWCPYCNMQVRELSENYSRLADAGVQPVLISVDAPDQTALLSATYDIPFPVLSDPDLLAHKAFNVVLQLDDKTLALYRQYGIDLPAWSDREHNTIAVASVFIVDTDGRVLLSHAVADYKQRPSIDQLLKMIETSKAGN